MEVVGPMIIHEAGNYFAFFYFLERILKVFNKYEIILKLCFQKKFSKYNNMAMNLFHRLQLFYLKKRLYFQERYERNQKKKSAFVNKMKREKKQLEENQKEKELFRKFGYSKCEHCKHYLNPELVIALCGDSIKKEFSDEDVDICVELNAKCKCGQPFHSKELDKYSQKFGNKTTVEFLEQKKKDLVYVNMPVLRHENKCY